MDNVSLILLVLLVFIGIYYYFLKSALTGNIFKKHGILYVPPKPIVGNMGSLLTGKFTVPELLQQVYSLHPEAKYVGLYEFSKPVIMLRDIDLIKSVAMKHFESFQDHHVFADKDMDPLFASSLFGMRGNTWKEMRSIVSPTFSSSKIKSMFMLMSSYAIDFADYLSTLPENNREIELKNLLTKYTNDMIASCAFGVTVDSKKDPRNAFYVYSKRATDINTFGMALKLMLYRNIPWLAKALGLRIIQKETSDFFNDLIRSTVKIRDEQGISRSDIVQLLMEIRNKKEASKEFTTDDIVANAFAFFFGSFDTVSTQLAFVLHHLAVNPNVQERLQKDIDQVLDTQDHLTYEAITNMGYLDAVVNEAMRINPVAASVDRVCVKRFELPPALPEGKPFVVEPGMNLWIPIYPIQHDPNYFDDPERFIPERFLVDGKRIANSGTFMPFGIGPRICIGNRFALVNMKIVLFHLLSRCVFKRCSKTSVPMKLSNGMLTISARDGFWMKVEPR